MMEVVQTSQMRYCQANEQEFIINYDIKYRMGDDLFAEEGEA